MLASGQVPDPFTYSILLNGFCKSGKLNEAVKVFQAMRNSGLELNIIFYNILIDGAYKSGHIDVAKELFRELYVNGLKPDGYTYNIMVNRLCKEGSTDRAYRLFRSMGDNGCLPNSISYNVMIQEFFRNNSTSKATQLLAEMVDKGFSADLCTATLYAKCCDYGQFGSSLWSNEEFTTWERCSWVYSEWGTTALIDICIIRGENMKEKNLVSGNVENCLVLTGGILDSRTIISLVQVADLESGRDRVVLK
ncbi:hypothetical protein V6N13_147454 [Hibiscus sabdariffa]